LTDGEVLPLPVKINELEIDQLDPLILYPTEDILCGLSHWVGVWG
jgi:hypothetical protein